MLYPFFSTANFTMTGIFQISAVAHLLAPQVFIFVREVLCGLGGQELETVVLLAQSSQKLKIGEVKLYIFVISACLKKLF